MHRTLTIKEKEVTGMFPVDSISWDWSFGDDDGREYSTYENVEHEIEFDDIVLIFHLKIKSYEGCEHNDVSINDIKEIWVGEELVELPWEDEKELIKILVKHYENPFNIE
ncbi:hypothetical protein J0X14_14385 [Muricauda sp. CAU 1633]|uniref:hypothetical protein n=1 Tax=Allomuricauda sp. CAU 1633 TaxID=2816036 RepID=UPI001A8F279F|nr:hypothetical protein [Muricauda sp. CAU 1633]MBO0323493.1 hypothetical protein [Muricauda sp. CAU 1633]